VTEARRTLFSQASSPVEGARLTAAACADKPIVKNSPLKLT